MSLARYTPDQPTYYSLRSPAAMRGRLMLEVASELAAVRTWPHKQPLIYMRAQGAEEWGVCLFGSDSAQVVHQVARGEVTFAIVNPGAILALAIRGLGPFTDPVPVRAITVLPQFDQVGFAVTEATGLRSLRDLPERRYPLRLSLRGQRDHSVLIVIDQVLAALGMTLNDITSWGGQVLYQPGTPDVRLPAVERGEVDAVWDEAMPMYAATALEMGMRFLSLDEEHLRALEGMGLRRVALPKEAHPRLSEDVWTIDFSGWIVYTLSSTPDDMVAAFCAALEARKGRIPYYGPDSSEGKGPLPLDQMCRDTHDGPLYIPLHPAAEAFWREKRYI